MIHISSTEFGKEVGHYQDAALSQPVVVTRNGRDREVLRIGDFMEAEIEAVRQVEPSNEAEAFNQELSLSV